MYTFAYIAGRSIILYMNECHMVLLSVTYTTVKIYHSVLSTDQDGVHVNQCNLNYLLRKVSVGIFLRLGNVHLILYACSLYIFIAKYIIISCELIVLHM